MKPYQLSIISFFVVGACFAAVETEVVPIKLGPKSFRDGDVIHIESVESTSPELEIGDHVTVSGKYRLDSTDGATLALFLTQTEGDGSEETDPTQIINAERGWHEFAVSIIIKHRGHLHLSFYDDSTGAPFGGVYFGTPEQVDSGMTVSIEHYKVRR